MLFLRYLFVAVAYRNQRIIYTNKGKFEPVVSLVGSSLSLLLFSKVDNCDFVMSFSNYVANTVFELLHAEYIDELGQDVNSKTQEFFSLDKAGAELEQVSANADIKSILLLDSIS